MTTSRAVLSLAAKISRSLEQGYAEYLEACDSYRADGYRAHYCEHGTNLWTDYDNICGPCEDGRTMSDGVQRREYALHYAKRRDEKCKAIIRAANELRDLGIEIDYAPIWKEITRLLTVE